MEAWEVELGAGNLHLFKDWPNKNIPRVAAGVYTVWNTKGEFMYVGMAGEGLTKEVIVKADKKKIKGLRDRLGKHKSGSRSGDEFCILIFDRIILRTLTREQIEEASRGELKLDSLIKDYICRNLSYRYFVTEDGSTVRDIEDHIKRGAWQAGLQPLLNPSP